MNVTIKSDAIKEKKKGERRKKGRKKQEQVRKGNKESEGTHEDNKRVTKGKGKGIGVVDSVPIPSTQTVTSPI